MEQDVLLNRTRIKFCGITRKEDALHAATIGVDALGFVFYEKSPRFVSVRQARKIIDSLPAFITTVGLFVNANRSDVENIAEKAGLDLLQFHGDESAQECEYSGRPYIKAIRMQKATDFVHASAEYSTAKALLLDTYDKSLFGGTGKQFDWSMIPDQRILPVILAGGLNPENVGTAIKAVRPYAVDVSGGIEMEKGVKDIDKMYAFIRGVNSARK